MSRIENEYQMRMARLSGRERVSRSLALLQWTREMLARQIESEKGHLCQERLKWEIALRLYGTDSTIRRMIESKLANVSD